jgi:hypothetical protein
MTVKAGIPYHCFAAKILHHMYKAAIFPVTRLFFSNSILNTSEFRLVCQQVDIQGAI